MDALIVTASQKTAQAIAAVVEYAGNYNVSFAFSGLSARRAICERGFDIVIVNGELPDEFGKGVAQAAAERKEGGVILLENAPYYEETLMEAAEYGIITVCKPLSKSALYCAVQTVRATNIRVQGLRAENRDLNKKLEDLRVINRAKIALIERMGYNENQAHKYIEKQAMNLRISKREVAMNILRTYEN